MAEDWKARTNHLEVAKAIEAAVIKRIELINFMSHERTVIEPSAGLTVLVGPNNCGKSAFVSALQVLCHNAKSSYVMRHGEKKCEIIVETEDGHVVHWSRTKSGSPKYLIDGQEFDRLKGGVPDELHEILGLGKVACEKDQFEVHFGEQKSPVFLLNDSGKAAAQFFASSSDAIRLVEMQDRHKSKVRDAKRDHSRLRAEQTELDRRLDLLDTVPEIDVRLVKCEKQFDQIQEASSELAQAEIVIRLMGEIQTELARCESVATCVRRLSPPPKLQDESPLVRLVDSIQEVESRFTITSSESEVMGQLKSPPTLYDIQAGEQLLAEWQGLESEYARCSELVLQAMGRLESPPALHATQVGGQLLVEWQDLESKYSRCAELVSVTDKLSRPPEFESESGLRTLVEKLDFSEPLFRSYQLRFQAMESLGKAPEVEDQGSMAALLSRLAGAKQLVSDCENGLKSIEDHRQVLELEMQTWVNANPQCPTCGSETSVEQWVESGGHRHG
ncbi:MAG: DNA repair exonuclease SbcCD ATPase subunit [Mariniblastus sp.]